MKFEVSFFNPAHELKCPLSKKVAQTLQAFLNFLLCLRWHLWNIAAGWCMHVGDSDKLDHLHSGSKTRAHGWASVNLRAKKNMTISCTLEFTEQDLSWLGRSIL